MRSEKVNSEPSDSEQILLVDDHIGDVTWLVDFLEHHGYEVVQVTNEKDAREKLEEVEKGQATYVLAIIDIMVSIRDIMDLVDLDEKFYEESRETGIRLCAYAREELKIKPEVLPIVCISARSDHEEIQKPLRQLGIRLFSRVPQSREESIREYLKEKLPVKRGSSGG